MSLNKIIIDPFIIDLDDRIIYGPYEKDRIPISFWSKAKEKYFEPDLMGYPFPIEWETYVDPDDDTQVVQKIVANETCGYIYVQNQALRGAKK